MGKLGIVKIFAESINSDKFKGVKCDTFLDFENGKCRENKTDSILFGENVNKSARGNYFVDVCSNLWYNRVMCFFIFSVSLISLIIQSLDNFILGCCFVYKWRGELEAYISRAYYPRDTVILRYCNNLRARSAPEKHYGKARIQKRCNQIEFIKLTKNILYILQNRNSKNLHLLNYMYLQSWSFKPN